MTKIQTFDHANNIVYEFHMEDGRLIRLRSWDYPSLKDFFDEWRNPYSHIGEVKPINRKHFIKAVTILCFDFEFDAFPSFWAALNNDDEYLRLANETITSQLIRMINQANKLSKALFKK